jgi:hypothetical protein
MPTYGPDGSIRLDTTNTIGSGGVGAHGGGGSVSTYSDEWFRSEMQGMAELNADRGYEHYEPGFRHGWDAAGRHRGRQWADVESDVEREWRGQHADRDWHEYRGAIRGAFERAMRVFEGEK